MNIQTAIQLTIESAHASRAAATARTYKSALDKFLEYLLENSIPNTLMVSSLSFDFFVRFPAWLALKGYAKQTRKVYIGGVKYLLDWLTIEGLLTPSHTDMLRYKQAVSFVNRRHESKLPRTASMESILKMLQATEKQDTNSPIKERDVAMMRFFYSSGCRVGEVVALKVRDINLDNRRAIIMGKGSKEDYVFFDSATAETIKLYWSVRGFREATHPVFARHDNAREKNDYANPLTTRGVRFIVNKLANLAGIEPGTITPHAFRHAVGVMVLQQAGLAAAQDILRHSSPTTTRVYAKITKKDLQEIHQKVFEDE